MPLHHAIYSSVEQVPREDWDRLTAADADLTMDRRLIGAFESTTNEGQCFTIVIRDDAGKAVALACTWMMRLDAANYPWLSKWIGPIRKAWPNFLRFGVLFCGLPIPAGQHHIRIAADAERAAVLEKLHEALGELAAKHHAMMVIVKEFDQHECDEMPLFAQHGYLRGEIPPRHMLDGPYGSFDGYCEAIKARYRSQITKSLKRLKTGGFRVEQVRGPIRLPEVYTDAVHKLYEAVWSKSQYRLEFYTPEFMRKLGRRFGDDASLTCVYQGDRLAGFTLGLRRGPVYHNLYSGLDYELNHQGDIYFNLFYHDLDFAWRAGATEIHLGQTSDDFKARLGARNEPMYLFIRPTWGVIRFGLKTFSKWALPKMRPVEPHDVFKTPGGGHKRAVTSPQQSPQRPAPPLRS